VRFSTSKCEGSAEIECPKQNPRGAEGVSGQMTRAERGIHCQALHPQLNQPIDTIPTL
jgi:hypothetical protein